VECGVWSVECGVWRVWRAFPVSTPRPLWVVRVGGVDGELRPWHYIYVHSIESRLIMREKSLYRLMAAGASPDIQVPFMPHSKLDSQRFTISCGVNLFRCESGLTMVCI